MTLYIFSALKTLRDIVPPAGLTGLVHDESAYTVSATIPMDLTVVPGEHIGFMCVDGRFRMFTVTKAENKDFDATTIITGIDTAVQELKETIVPELQQLEVNLHDSVVALLDASDARSSWSVTGSGPADLKKHRAYYTSMWTMLETLAQLYEWRIIPHYYFASGAITGRTIELAADTATFRGRILQSKKDASNVYVIKSTPPITRLYGLGPSKSQEPGVSENLTFAEAEWSAVAGDPADKPKEQTYVDDPAAVAKYGVRSSTVQFDEVEDEKDLLQKTWNHLQTIKEPTCTVEATVQDLEQVPGYETKIIRLGDLVPVRLSNAAMEEARVIGIKRDYVKPWLTKVTIGDKTASLSTQVTSLMTNALHTHETLTIYKNRFHEDEALIQLNAQFVQANAERIELNADLIELNAKQIALNAEQIQLNADQIELNAKNIALNAEKIQLNADQIELNAKDIALNAENIELNAKNIALNAEKIQLNANQIELNAKDIALNADNITLNAEKIQANADAIELNAKNIALNAENIELNAKDIALNAENIALNAEKIQANADQIDVNAKAITVNAENIKLNADEISVIAGRVDVQAETITAQAKQISAKADRIDLEGFVSMDEFESLEGRIADLEAGLGTVTVLNANTINTTDLNAIFGSFSSMSFGGSTVSKRSITMGSISTAGTALSAGGALDLSHSHAVSVGDDGTITLGEVSSSGGSFNIADTSYYKNGVSAAKNSVTLSASGWQSGRNTVTASNGKSVAISLPSFSTSGGTTWNSANQTTVYFYTGSVSGPLASKTVDASSIYTKGADSVTLSAGGWSDNKNVITASNGQTLTVDASSIYEAGEDSVTLSAGEWSSNKMTVTASNGKTLEVDATSIFQAGSAGGYNAGYEMAIVGAMIELDGSTVKVYSPDGGIAGPTLDISDELESSYNDGYADATPASASRVATYDSANNAYNVTVAVKSADGSSRSFDLVAISASAAYEAGYKAAKDSATLTCEGVNAIVTFGDGTTKTLDLSEYVTVTGGIRSITNTAQNYYMASGYANAYINGVDVDYTTFSKAQSFS